MDLKVEKGMTLVCKHDDNSLVMVHTKEEFLGDIIIEFKNFLLAAGFSEKSVNEYIALD